MKQIARMIPVFLLWCLAAPAATWALTVNVVDTSGNAISGFRWLLEEDNAHDPGVDLSTGQGIHRNVTPGMPTNNPLSVGFHTSYAPTVNSGESTTSSANVTLPDGSALPPGRYIVSVLPYGDWSDGGTRYTEGGAGVVIPGDTSVDVVVTSNQVLTGQISIKVFRDDHPLNGVQESVETGLAGFSIFLGDAGGDIAQDAFGNKLGTSYLKTCDAAGLNPGSGTDYCDVDADGLPDVDVAGQGLVITDANGEARIKFLRPDLYNVEAVPPEGQEWFQTTGAAARNLIPVAVRPNEPPFLTAFGAASFHASFGFVELTDVLGSIPTPGTKTEVVGQVKKGHFDAPPGTAIHPGAAPTTSPCLVALTDASEKTVFVGECQPGGAFSIANVPPGTYQLVVFDLYLGHLPVFQTVIASASGGTLDVGTIATTQWFAEQDHYIFLDANKNGFRDPGEQGLEDQVVNLRFRDGTVYQSYPTDTTGFIPFEEIVPPGNFMIAEVDFGRREATGVTVVVDAGGPVTNDQYGEGKRNPLIDPATNLPYRTETGPAILQAFQQAAGQNSRFEWGKADYDEDVNVAPYDDFPGPGDTDIDGDSEYDNNGGISGIVYYAVTRAEDEPRFAAGEPWEAGIPRVQVNLYRDNIDNATGNPAPFGDKIPDDLNGNGQLDLADIDNHPFGWSTGGNKGPEDLDHDMDGAFDLGDAVEFATSDSFDDNLPSGCYGNPPPVVIHGTPIPVADCVEGQRLWNQSVFGVFDGGFAFGPGDPLLVPGNYIVEAGLPPGLKHVKEEDRNVDFGTVPIPALLPAECVGEPHTVSELFSFLTADDGTPLPGVDPGNPDNLAPFSLETLPLCDRKKVEVYQGQNAVADFFMFSDVPRAARLVGMVGDGINATIPGDPHFGTERGLPWIPIAIFDYANNEFQRTYSDEFGAYESMVSSTYDIDLATPTGVGPQIHEVCVNHPGPIPDPNNPLSLITDPFFNPLYATTCYQFDFWAGRTTYAATPIIRKAGFAGLTTTSLDCELPTGTPAISQVIGSSASGTLPAYIDGDGDSFTIDSPGLVDVPNPDYPGDSAPADGYADDPPSEPLFVQRDFGFGTTEGTVSVGGYTFPAADVSWSDTSITVTVNGTPVASNALATGQLTVTHFDGTPSSVGLTLTVGDSEPASMALHHVSAGGSIQAAIDAADEDDLILVDPGTYRELVIVTKRVRLQGAGAGSTVIDANPVSNIGSPLDPWRVKLQALYAGGELGLVSGQDQTTPLFFGQEGPGVLVSPDPNSGSAADFTLGENARVDGFTIVNAAEGGAIFANTNAARLQVSNNRMQFNHGYLGGAVRVGNAPSPAGGNANAPVATFSPNPDVRIHHNHVLENGSLNAGGGVSLYGGADGYEVTENHICGNTTEVGGAGVGHLGLSHDGLIARNKILFNEAFPGEEVVVGGGGGIEISGLPKNDVNGNPIVGDGAGSVTIEGNLIQGNLAANYDGGGISALLVNGTADAYTLSIFDNFIVNNVSGLAGGAISLQNALHAHIVHNTIAHNDAAAVSTLTFLNGVTQPSTPQVGGIVARPHTPELLAALGGASTFSQPETFSKNIIWKNRSFFYDAVNGLQPRPAGLYWDLGVLGTADALDPRDSVLTNYQLFDASNFGVDPMFASSYENSYSTASAPAEGGNFIQLFLAPTRPQGDYHLTAGSAAIDSADSAVEIAQFASLGLDIDGEPRPDSGNNPTMSDRGADETQGLTPGVLPVGAPVASFTAVVVAAVSGDQPLTVQFTDTSANGPISSWLWDFGDGSGSTEQNPGHTYFTPGMYTVTLTVDNGVGSDSVTEVDFVTVNAVAPPVAAFTATPTSGDASLMVDFTDQSTGAATWSWDFGDSIGTSTAQNPSYTYGSPGTYTVSLTVTNAGGTSTETKVAYIAVNDPTPPAPPVQTVSPVGDARVSSAAPATNFGLVDPLWVDEDDTRYRSYLQFDVPTLAGPVQSATLRLYVTNASTKPLSVYSVGNGWTETGITWNNAPPIGGGALDQIPNVPLNQWIELDVTSAVTAPGLVSFGLKIGGDNSARFNSREGAHAPELVIDAPSVTPPTPMPPVAQFSGSPTSGGAPLTVNFSDLSTGNPTSWLWDFGDSIGTSTAQNPSYTYGSTGMYTVTLTATNGQGPNTIIKTNYITVNVAPTEHHFEPIHDARVQSTDPNATLGLSDPLWVEHDHSYVLESYLKFDITGLSGTVQSATLRLYVINGSQDGVEVHAASNDYGNAATAWTESGLTWNNAPGIAGGALDSVSPVPKNQWIELDVTSAVTGNGTLSFGLRNTGGDSARFNSKEGANRPELVIVTQ